MVKNYISTGILLIGLLFSFNNSYSQAVEFTGNREDFNESQKITGDATVDYYVSFDEVTKTMYFGAFRTTGTFEPDDHFTIYLDTDPEPELTNIVTGYGSTTGFLRDSNTPILPFNADHTFALKNGVANHFEFIDEWLQQYGTITDEYSDQNALEIAIQMADIGNPYGIYFSMFMSFNGGFYGHDDVNYPINFNGSNTTGYFGGIGVSSKISNPTAYINTPIFLPLDRRNQTLTVNGKYAYMEVRSRIAVDGEIELVAGGIADFNPGSGLTVNGNFINNGLVTLNSSQTSYSSLIPQSVTGNGIIRYNRHVNASVEAGGRNDLISAPLTGQSFGDFATANSLSLPSHPSNSNIKGFAPFNKDSGKYQNYNISTTDVNIILEPGIGYRSASAVVSSGSTGGPLTFTGEVTTGTINMPVERTTNNFGIWNLVGNPYPSYINQLDLMTNNAHVFDPVYYGIYGYNGSSVAGELWTVQNATNAEPIAPGQGFFVSSNSLAGTFTFSPDLRMPSGNNDFIANRIAAAIDNVAVRLTVTNSSRSTHTDIHFHTNGGLSFDLGYDSGQIGNPDFSIFSKLVEESTNQSFNVPLAIQTLPYDILETEVSVPIGIKAIQGEQITISAIHTPTPRPLPENVEIYFDDIEAQTSKLLSTSTLDHNDHYIFTPSTNLTGEMGQFFLRFTNKSLSISNPDFDALNVYSPLNSGNLIVRGTVNEVTSLEIFDLNGRLLQSFSVQPNQSENRFEVSNLATGIYIVKLNNKTQSKIKKIQLNNKL